MSVVHCQRPRVQTKTGMFDIGIVYSDTQPFGVPPPPLDSTYLASSPVARLCQSQTLFFVVFLLRGEFVSMRGELFYGFIRNYSVCSTSRRA